jgi:DNA invertase Pin-like site-specific DNA recombinase
MRVFGYVRCSTEEQAISGVTIEAQKQDLKKEAETKGLKILDIFVDAGISGTVPPMERPNMRKMLLKLQAGDADGVIVCKIDRLARDIRSFVNLTAYFDANKIGLVLLSPKIDTFDSTGKFMLNIFACVADLEREMISDRTVKALQYKKSQNQRTGTIPFGKKLESENSNILIDDEEEQKTILRVLELRKTKINVLNKSGESVEKPYTFKKIADVLIEEKRKNKEGNVAWFPSQIQRMMQPYFPKKEKIKKSKGKKLNSFFDC